MRDTKSLWKGSGCPMGGVRRKSYGTSNRYNQNFMMHPSAYRRKSPVEDHMWNVSSGPQRSLSFRSPSYRQEVS